MRVLHRNSVRALLAVTLPLFMLVALGLAASTSTAAAPTTSALDFRNQMRRLWEEHIGWTRLYIVSALADLPDKDLVAQRLLHNQDQIGDAIKPYYGDAAGNKLASLLREHIAGAAQLLASARAGDSAGVDANKRKWYANADDIASFLAGANPRAWPHAVIAATMKMHLDLTLQEAIDRLQGNWAADVADYDKIETHILGMADALSGGIISRFPGRFSQDTGQAQLSLRENMREAWQDHIIWTRLYIVSALANLPDKTATTERLLQNQVTIGDAIKPFYGDAAGTQLTALLKEHILGAADLLAAAKSGDSAAVQAASDKWYANANDIASFLNSANPTAWPLDALKAGMKMHLDLTLQEAVDHLKGNYQQSIADYDKVSDHILGLADTLSGGIISQFPAQFGASTGSMPVGMPMTGHEEIWSVWQMLLTGLVLVAGGWTLLHLAPKRSS